jgi:hypothetical protein
MEREREREDREREDRERERERERRKAWTLRGGLAHSPLHHTVSLLPPPLPAHRISPVPPHSLRSNNIGPDGATAIAAPLALLTSLKILELRCSLTSCVYLPSRKPTATKSPSRAPVLPRREHACPNSFLSFPLSPLPPPFFPVSLSLSLLSL